MLQTPRQLNTHQHRILRKLSYRRVLGGRGRRRLGPRRGVVVGGRCRRGSSRRQGRLGGRGMGWGNTRRPKSIDNCKREILCEPEMALALGTDIPVYYTPNTTPKCKSLSVRAKSRPCWNKWFSLSVQRHKLACLLCCYAIIIYVKRNTTATNGILVFWIRTIFSLFMMYN